MGIEEASLTCNSVAMTCSIAITANTMWDKELVRRQKLCALGTVTWQ